MNPFAEHNLNQQAYEQMLSEPVNNAAGNFISYPLDGTGRPTATTAQYPATVSTFADRDVFGPAGFVRRLVADVIVRKEVLPNGTRFRMGQLLQATAVGGASRVCEVQDVEDTYTEWRLTLWDRNQNA